MQPDLMAKRDGFRIAAMFPANTEFDLWTRLLAQLDRHFQQLADTNRIQSANGSASKISFCMQVSISLPVSSRDKPKVICVKSFVPKEKNSASLAISSAVRAARGVSTIVPIK